MCIHENHRRKMLHALNYLNTNLHTNRKMTSRQSDVCKKAHIQACRGKKMRANAIEKLRNRPKRIGFKMSDDAKNNMRIAKQKSSYVPSKEKNKNHSIRMCGDKNSTAKKVFIVYKGIEMCYLCLKYFHYDSKIGYSLLEKLRKSRYIQKN